MIIIGDFVTRISYGNDIVFFVDKIIAKKSGNIAMLKGLTVRITADAPISDLEYVNAEKVESIIKKFDDKISKRAQVCGTKVNQYMLSKRKLAWGNSGKYKELIYTGKILHLDRRSTIYRKIHQVL